ncbi:type ISP restriction/modification enzyme [Leptolyngbyaceae cyanobacterium UHCC 1019]
MKKAKIFYFTLQDEQTKAEKLAWFKRAKFEKIPFEQITPDKKANWINLSDNDFDHLLPLIDKEVKDGKSKQAIFILFSRGVETTRDEWVYDFSQANIRNKIKFFIENYNKSITDEKSCDSIKWSSSLTEYANSKINILYQAKLIIKALYRPYSSQYFYSEKLTSQRLTKNHYEIYGSDLNRENSLIGFMGQSAGKPFAVIATNLIPDLNCISPASGGTQCLPLYRYEKDGTRIDNITDWGLNQFQTHYSTLEITKLDIFHYVYAVLHHPAYRSKYEFNLKREFPRIPFYENFQQWANWGKQLMDLHINFEDVELYDLERIGEGVIDETHATIQASLLDENSNTQTIIPNQATPKCKLKADKVAGTIELDSVTSLSGIPAIAWDYKLGNRSALEWILDQYKEKKPKDPTIAKLFNTYRFADYKEHVIELLQKVCTVSVETMKVIQQMPDT